MDWEEKYKLGLIEYEDYVLIKQYVERLLANNMPVIFNLRHLRRILEISKSEQDYYFGRYKDVLYRKFSLPKKSGGVRIIDAPIDELKQRQSWIKRSILDNIPVSDYACGFVRGKSIVDNANPHVGKELVINFDIVDFFPSIKYKDVFKIFYYVGYNKQVSHLLTKLCVNEFNILPQGAPTSPAISNIVLLKLDKRLSSLSDCFRCSYTRYADDITFSGDKSISVLVPIVEKIIQEEGFQVNEKKLRLQYSNKRQEVTGIIVNDKLAISKVKIRELENAIYYSKKYGVEDHMKHIGCYKSFYKEHLYGLAYFIHMVEPKKGEQYLRELDQLEWYY